MQVFRCRICGEAYVGPEKSHTCPFCGAHKSFFIDAKDWREENKGIELSDISRKNLETTLELEVGNARFYKGSYEKAQNPEVAGMFKSLAKMEAEHASVASKLLGVEVPKNTKEAGECFETDVENIQESYKRESGAIEKYKRFESEAVEQRVKTVFGALVEIEKDHLAIDEEELEKLNNF